MEAPLEASMNRSWATSRSTIVLASEYSAVSITVFTHVLTMFGKSSSVATILAARLR